MIFLISAYSKTDMDAAFLEVEKDTAFAIKHGLQVFSPIVYAHAMAKKYDLPKDAKFWETFNDHMLRNANSILVKRNPALLKSTGCKREYRLAHKLGKPIEFYTTMEKYVQHIQHS